MTAKDLVTHHPTGLFIQYPPTGFELAQILDEVSEALVARHELVRNISIVTSPVRAAEQNIPGRQRMPNLACEKCDQEFPVAEAHTVTARHKDYNSLDRLHFCSAVCWVQWFRAIEEDVFETIILPALDGYDIGRAQQAMRKKVA